MWMFWRVIPSSVGKGRDSVTETWEDFPEGQGFTCKEVIQVRRNPRQAWGGGAGKAGVQQTMLPSQTQLQVTDSVLLGKLGARVEHTAGMHSTGDARLLDSLATSSPSAME